MCQTWDGEACFAEHSSHGISQYQQINKDKRNDFICKFWDEAGLVRWHCQGIWWRINSKQPPTHKDRLIAHTVQVLLRSRPAEILTVKRLDCSWCLKAGFLFHNEVNVSQPQRGTLTSWPLSVQNLSDVTCITKKRVRNPFFCSLKGWVACRVHHHHRCQFHHTIMLFSVAMVTCR